METFLFLFFLDSEDSDAPKLISLFKNKNQSHSKHMIISIEF